MKTRHTREAHLKRMLGEIQFGSRSENCKPPVQALVREFA
jgi:hypothetical protein